MVEDELFVIDGVASRGRVKKITGRGPKAKGRAGCESVQKILLKHFPGLTENDIFIKATSMGGADLHLSDVALKQMNFAIEVKNSEGLNIFKALKQAELNGQKVGRPYIVFFKRANSEIFAALPAADFLLLAAFRDNPIRESGIM